MFIGFSQSTEISSAGAWVQLKRSLHWLMRLPFDTARSKENWLWTLYWHSSESKAQRLLNPLPKKRIKQKYKNNFLGTQILIVKYNLVND